MGVMGELGGVAVYRAEPVGEPRGAIIVIHEIWGLVDQIKGIADRWAGEGYLAIAPDIMSHIGITPEVGAELTAAVMHPDEVVRTAMQPRLREALAPIRQPEYASWAIAQLTGLLDELEEIPGIAGRIAVTGYCFGGTYAFALAAEDDRVAAAVPFYGTAPDLERIQDISCPILALYGELDPPLIDALPAVRDAMVAADIDFTDVVYPGAMHAFFNETNARTYHPDFAADAWAKATAFVDEHLG
jgi:carboxymethylenebutenolidase